MELEIGFKRPYGNGTKRKWKIILFDVEWLKKNCYQSLDLCLKKWSFRLNGGWEFNIRCVIHFQDGGWKLNRSNYYQEGWLATGNARGLVGVTFTTSHCRTRASELPLRSNYNLRGHRSEVDDVLHCIESRWVLIKCHFMNKKALQYSNFQPTV